MMRLFLAELKKLLLLFKADPRALAAGLIAPTVILLVFALTFGDFTSLKLAWVDEDGSTYSAQLEESIFSQISPLGDRPYFEAVPAEREEAQALYEAGKVNGIVACSEGFGAALARGENGVIDYSFNNYNTDMAKNLRLYLEEGILDFYRATDSDLQLEVREVINVDAQLPWFDIIAVAVFLLAFLLGAMFNMLYLFYTEKHDDTLYEYRLAPCGIWASLAARVVVALFAGALAAAVNGLLVYALTGLNLAPHLLQLALPMLVLGLTYVLFAAAVALFVGSFSGAAVFTMATTVVLWFLSGATAQIKYATGILRDIALAIPNTYGLSQMRGAVFAMDASVGGILSVQAGWLIMLGWLALAAMLAFALYHRKLARSVR